MSLIHACKSFCFLNITLNYSSVGKQTSASQKTLNRVRAGLGFIFFLSTYHRWGKGGGCLLAHYPPRVGNGDCKLVGKYLFQPLR